VREGVTVDYRNIDCGNRPDPAAFARDWDRTIVTAIKPLDPRLTAVTAALNKSHVNGGAKVAQFEIEAIDAVAWVLARNRLSKYDFFRHFFERAAVVKAFPEAAMPTADIASFEAEDIPTAIETLSRVISGGGAYRRFAGSDSDALKLARSFLNAASSAGVSETSAWVNWKPWTGWFFDVAWDSTFFWFDPRSGVATVLLVTDTD
jgi:hypothetical protein